MDAEPPKAPSQISMVGFPEIPSLPPGVIDARVGFSYKPPDDPLEAAHKREMAKIKEQFRQKLVLIILSVTATITLMVTGICGYIALFDSDHDLRKNAATALAGIIGTLLGAVLGLNGAKMLGTSDKQDKE